jgi:hypothetical protein
MEKWVIGKDSLWLGKGVSYARCRAKARQFDTLEEAKEFAFLDREPSGNTFFQKLGKTGQGTKYRFGLSASEVSHLKLKPSSVMDDVLLLTLSVKVFG